ncbi:MAG: acyl-CoA dehydrogenase family protein [Acidimicrobiales bacterium]
METRTGAGAGAGAGPVAAARQVAEEVLFPRAEEVDQAPVVPRSNLEALARAGLFGVTDPTGRSGRAPGGSGAPLAALLPAGDMRRVQEALAGACGATHFVWAQHHSLVRMLASGANGQLRLRWLERLCRGEALAGVAFAYLRRPGPPAVSAERVAGGWRVRGTAPFVTSWGLADVFLVVGETGDGQLVWFCLEGVETAAVQPSAPLPLAVLQATSTVRLGLDDLLVPDHDVVGVEARAAWEARDRRATPQPSAAALGVADRCCRLLAARAAELGEVPGEGPVGGAAAALAGELERCRAEAYGLADALTGSPAALDLGEHLAAMVDARAWGLDLAERTSLALVAAVGGRAMGRSHPAQRLAREAAFYAVQAQTGAIRRATLGRLSRS